MKNKSLKFTLQIQVKPYVKKFIENNYGAPADFTNFPAESAHLFKLLRKPSYRRNSIITESMNTYSEILEILISEDTFYRYGWELTKTNTIVFGKHYENQLKFFMRTYIAIYTGLGLPLFLSIHKFQQAFDLPEDYWKYDSIKKDFYRNKFKHDINFNNQLLNSIENIILGNLSDLGTNCHNLNHHNETTK